MFNRLVMTKYSLYLLHLAGGSQHPICYPTGRHAKAFFTCLCICLAAGIRLTAGYWLCNYRIFFFNLPVSIVSNSTLSYAFFLSNGITLLPSFNRACTRCKTAGSILWLLPFLLSGAKNAASPS